MVNRQYKELLHIAQNRGNMPAQLELHVFDEKYCDDHGIEHADIAFAGEALQSTTIISSISLFVHNVNVKEDDLKGILAYLPAIQP
jgi:hypothetical protein